MPELKGFPGWPSLGLILFKRKPTPHQTQTKPRQTPGNCLGWYVFDTWYRYAICMFNYNKVWKKPGPNLTDP
ncbi:hypothetical protein A4R26_15225 [Niastella populi]|uniref:Uncharacterized protein n=1 Tax=Niastella populi TaxID=550983 RepID=A0A1V9G399_9BACT|nr:hypothetical protein A4R26_15225 [Niastella populi]